MMLAGFAKSAMTTEQIQRFAKLLEEINTRRRIVSFQTLIRNHQGYRVNAMEEGEIVRIA